MGKENPPLHPPGKWISKYCSRKFFTNWEVILGWGDKETGDCCRRCWGLESICKAPGGRSGWSWVVLLCVVDASPLISFPVAQVAALLCTHGLFQESTQQAELTLPSPCQLGAACLVSAAPGAPRKPWPCWREPSEPQRARPRSRSQPARGQNCLCESARSRLQISQVFKSVRVLHVSKVQLEN